MGQFSKVKNIVFKDERDAIRDLRSHSDDLELRAHDIAEAMPRAIELQALNEESREDLQAALSEPVVESVKQAMQRDPESYADAMFPVLGPAIRKAVSEAMRALAERLNRTVEHSFSARGIKWRLESFRTGTPLADIILRDTLIYRVEQIFVIERLSGQLVSHVQDATLDGEQDSDAVSAMLTAIQDFVRDSFGAYEQTDLNTVQVGGRTVWVLYGPQLMIAAVFFGSPSSDLRASFHAANEYIHRRCGDELTYAGTLSAETQSDVNSALFPLLTSDATGSRTTDNQTLWKYGKFLTIALLGFFILAVILSIHNRVYENNVEAYARTLKTQAGVVVLDVSHESKPSTIRLLKDPSVSLPENIFEAHDLSESDVLLVASAFQSSAPEVLERKIRTFLKVPDSVSLRWENNTLVASGKCSKQFYERFVNLPFNWLGVVHIDYTRLEVVMPE